MFFCNNDINELLRKPSAQLDKLNVWFSVNRLSLNIAKTNYTVIIFWKSRIENLNICKQINKFTINGVEAIVCLGELIDTKVTRKHHISLLKSKLSKYCAVRQFLI